jgi:hypothetical protein
MEASVLVPLEQLSPDEVHALAAAAAWYAKRHESMISERADDVSASAIAERERYLMLHSALWKLGVRLRLPDGIGPAA